MTFARAGGSALCGARRQSRAPRRSTPPPSTGSSRRSRTSNSRAPAPTVCELDRVLRRDAGRRAAALRVRRRRRLSRRRHSPARRRRVRSASCATDLGRVFGAPIMDRGVWGVDVRSLDTGERLYSLNAGKLMMPASNMKILTLAAAAEVLGWDYRFTTTLETAGTVDGRRPARRPDRRAATAIRRSTRARDAPTPCSTSGPGARRPPASPRSTGASSATTRRSTTTGIGAGWAWDYLQYGYAAPVGALEFNENVATLTIAPGASSRRPRDRAPDARQRASRCSTARSTGGAGLGRTRSTTAVTSIAPTLEVTGSIPSESPETDARRRGRQSRRCSSRRRSRTASSARGHRGQRRGGRSATTSRRSCAGARARGEPPACWSRPSRRRCARSRRC